MTKKIFLSIICLIMCFSLTSCFSNKEKVTNNTINNKVINVSDYTINDVEDAIVVASEKAEQSCVAIIESNLATSSLGSAVIIKRTAYSNGIIVNDDSNNITNYEYYAVTNNHVVDGTININCRVYLSDKISNSDYQSTSVEIVDRDEKLDLALIKFTSAIYLPYATVKNSNDLKKGQIVLAIGTPMSIDFFNTVTYGIVSHPYRYAGTENDYNYYIQHDVAINPGNSGGGLFNLEGELIGINTWKLVDEEDVVIGMGFAIPSSVLYTKYKNYITSYK